MRPATSTSTAVQKPWRSMRSHPCAGPSVFMFRFKDRRPRELNAGLQAMRQVSANEPPEI